MGLWALVALPAMSQQAVVTSHVHAGGGSGRPILEATHRHGHTLERPGLERGPCLVCRGLRAADRRDEAAAIELLGRAVDEHPDDDTARIALARALEDYCLVRPARRQLAEVLSRDPDNGEALASLARIQLKENDHEAAIATARTALLLDPDDGPTRAILARALTRTGRYDEALGEAELAVSIDATDAAARNVLAAILFRQGDLARSRQELLATVRIDRDNAYAHHRLGTGSGPTFRDGDRSAATNTAIRAAAAALGRSEPDLAVELLRDTLDDSMGDYKVHHLIAIALNEIDLRHHALSHQEAFRALPGRPIDRSVFPHPLRSIFPEFDALSDVERRVIEAAVAPLHRYLGALRSSGATHRILPLETSVCELPEFRSLANRRTFDRRLYAHVRGLGGRQAVTGREYLWEAADYRYNTLAHEFAHQVHLCAFSPAEKARVEELYARALEEDRCLDYYARSDATEYFAQGYEAYVSLFKRPCLSITARHDRAELRVKDPALHDFIASITDSSSETPEFLADFNYLVGRLMLSLDRPRDARERLLAALEATGAGSDDVDLEAGIRQLLLACDEPLGIPTRPAPRESVAAPPHPGEPYSPED